MNLTVLIPGVSLLCVCVVITQAAAESHQQGNILVEEIKITWQASISTTQASVKRSVSSVNYLENTVGKH